MRRSWRRGLGEGEQETFELGTTCLSLSTDVKHHNLPSFFGSNWLGALVAALQCALFGIDLATKRRMQWQCLLRRSRFCPPKPMVWSKVPNPQPTIEGWLTMRYQVWYDRIFTSIFKSKLKRSSDQVSYPLIAVVISAGPSSKCFFYVLPIFCRRRASVSHESGHWFLECFGPAPLESLENACAGNTC